MNERGKPDFHQYCWLKVWVPGFVGITQSSNWSYLSWQASSYYSAMEYTALSFAMICIFLAAIVRGFSGFGFSLLSITALSLVYTPREIVPTIFIMEIMATIRMLPDIWKDIHWRSLLPLVIGCLIGTPLGVWALVHVPPAPLQLAMSVFVLVATGLLARGFALKTIPGTATATAAGTAAGLANGAFGIAGPPVILFYFSSPAAPAAGRASLAAFFFFTDLIGLANQAPHGLVTKDSLIQALLFLPVLLLGIWVGSRSFRSTSPEGFRKAVLLLLALLALTAAAKAISQMI